MTYFFSQSFPDIRAKLKRLEKGPLTPQIEVLAVAFKVYNRRDEKLKNKCLLKPSNQPHLLTLGHPH